MFTREPKRIVLKEHEKLFFGNEHNQIPAEYKDKVNINKIFNKDNSGDNSTDNQSEDTAPDVVGGANLQLSYYVGLIWLVEDQCFLEIQPKFENLDYYQMFLTCLINKNKKIRESIHTVYSINIESKAIPCTQRHAGCTPLLIAHFITLVERIVQKGLMKKYITITNQYTSKIKGKVLLSKYYQNTMAGRGHIIPCRIQEYQIDCHENQLLKKALRIVESYLLDYDNQKQDGIVKYMFDTLAFCLRSLSRVSDTFNNELKSNTIIPNFYHEYNPALQLAQLLIKQEGILAGDKKNKHHLVLPHSINMPRLFELYVLSKIIEAYGEGEVAFQFSSDHDRPDFLLTSKKLVVDAKYKNYGIDDKARDQNGNKISKNDIRQIASYIINKNICRELGLDENQIAQAIIVYPDQTAPDTLVSQDLLSQPITDYKHLFKIGIKLPQYQDSGN